MNKFIACLLATLTIFATSYAKSPDKDNRLNVMSFNIRLDTPVDSGNKWDFRKDYASSVIRFYDVDVYGSQEVFHHQLTDMLDRLPGYSHIGVGREGGEKGEYSPIIYRTDRLDVLKSGTFWLSEDITAVGKLGWDAACPRVATWAIFKDKNSHKKFFFLNTHLDHKGKIARKEGAKLILSQAEKLSEGLPVIITGDFNATPDAEPIKVLTDEDNPFKVTHARDLSQMYYGPKGTFHDFGRIPYEKRKWIDYIFIRGNFEVLKYGVLNESNGNLFPSDHCPIISTLIIK